jgi:hypothetical protein
MGAGNPAPYRSPRQRFNQAAFVGAASGLSAHFAASVFIGSTLSHLRQRSSVLPVRSVIAIKRLLHFGQRVWSMKSSLLSGKSRTEKPKGKMLFALEPPEPSVKIMSFSGHLGAT